MLGYQDEAKPAEKKEGEGEKKEGDAAKKEGDAAKKEGEEAKKKEEKKEDPKKADAAAPKKDAAAALKNVAKAADPKKADQVGGAKAPKSGLTEAEMPKLRAKHLINYSKEEHEAIDEKKVNAILKSSALEPGDNFDDISCKSQALKDLAHRLEAKSKYHDEEREEALESSKRITELIKEQAKALAVEKKKLDEQAKKD